MVILTPQGWTDYELLDSGDGQRLERFGPYTLVRPDPQIIWKPRLQKSEWQKADAIFTRTKEDRGNWKFNSKLPEKWLCKYQNISFWVKLSPFKHTGVFPEQSIHWDFISEKVSSRLPSNNNNYPSSEPQANREVNILNLFGYTGIASLVAAAAGAKVTHVDASYPTIGWARENQKASGLDEKPIRWMLDDCLKFVQREIKRGVKYDGIIMDPPSFGHGPEGEAWKFNFQFPHLLNACKQVLSDDPLFIIINAYAISTSAVTLENMLKDLKLGGTIESGELALKEKSSDRLLSTGIFARWSK